MKNYLLIFAISLGLYGCGGSSGGASSGAKNDACSDASNDTFSCSDMLANIVTDSEVLAGSLKTQLTQLKTDINAYCEDIPDMSKLNSAQNQFNVTMETIQKLEVMQFDVIEQARDDFYVWPSNDISKVDLQVANNPAGTQNIAQVPNGRRSLTAVEYMLFQDDALQSSADIYTEVQNWIDTTGQRQRKAIRCEYASVIVDDLITKAAGLESDLSKLDLSSQSDSLQEGANKISDALFYIDKQTKDAKLTSALPQESSGEFKISALESKFANTSRQNIKNNLLAAKALLTGTSGLGLKDYLSKKGQTTLANDMVTALDAAIANVDAINSDFKTIISGADANDVSACINATDYQAGDSNLIKVCALQKKIKVFTDLLKEEFILALSFSKPASSSGDND